MERLEFERRLMEANVGHDLAMILSHHREKIVEMEKQLTIISSLISDMATAMQGFARLNHATMERVVAMEKFGKPDGVDVSSVKFDPDA
jgi:Mg2+ and Co2+ transporter CorA